MTNSTYKKIPLAGFTFRYEYQQLEAQGQRVVRLQTLQAWGKAVTLFAREKPGEVMVWLENGASEESMRWWHHLSAIVVGSEGPIGDAMKLLVHQNFPGQFRDLGPALCDRGHEVKAIGSQRHTDSRIELLRYEHKLENVQEYTASKWMRIHRSEHVANIAMGLATGLGPDVMLAHPGWGEALLLRQVFSPHRW